MDGRNIYDPAELKAEGFIHYSIGKISCSEKDTGYRGAGFIGSHLCSRLIEEGNVICADNFLPAPRIISFIL